MNDMWGNSLNGMGTNPNFPRYNPNGFNTSILPRYELIKVKGEESARNFRMGPNSDILLLDETQPILYHVQTDGAGYVGVMAYDLVPRISTPPIDINQLAQRVAQLEETLNARQSNSQSGKQKKQRTSSTTTIDTTITDTGSKTINESI